MLMSGAAAARWGRSATGTSAHGTREPTVEDRAAYLLAHERIEQLHAGRRISVEDKMLLRVLGENDAAYRRDARAMIPLLH